MVLGTGHHHDLPRKQRVLQLGGLKSLLALLGNDAASVQVGVRAVCVCVCVRGGGW